MASRVSWWADLSPFHKRLCSILSQTLSPILCKASRGRVCSAVPGPAKVRRTVAAAASAWVSKGARARVAPEPGIDRGELGERVTVSKLSTYQAKRDFTRTSEPQGRPRCVRPSALRFVIQKHAATRLHYDLRLELDGVFKSWAVTKGPSLDPHDKRLAVEVEDHPLDYGDFEGTIPKGQYGGGTVQLWDRGYWAPEGDDAPRQALAKGDLKFMLEGERLHGSWVLVRMKHDRTGGKRTNWLLIKHRDERRARRRRRGRAGARTARSPRAGRMEEIAAGKGRAPKPFMTAERRPPSRTRSGTANRGAAPPRPRDRRAPKPTREAARPSRSRPRPARVRRAAALPAASSGRPAGRAGCTRSSSTATACSCGSRRQGDAEDPQGPRLDGEVRAPSPRPARDLPDCIIDGEVVALDAERRAGFRRAAGGAVRGQDRRPGLLRLRPAVRGRRGPARAAAGRAQGAAARRCSAGATGRRCSATSSISRPAATRCCGRPAACRWRASSPSGSTRPIAPAAARAGPRPSAAPATRW